MPRRSTTAGAGFAIATTAAERMGANGFGPEQSTASERQAAGEAGAKAKRPGTR
jgi:hypothetical protein